MTTDFDADLARTVRHTSHMRQLFYAVVLLVALTGQVWGAHEALHLPLLFAIPAVAALELGGIVVLSNADVRRRLGERATGSRLLSAAIAAGAVAFNWLAHDNKLLAGFFAGMSALGYLVWLMHTGNQRRDRLRATGDLPPTTPAYEIGHWLRHPALTMRAKSLAKADATLGLYASLDAAREQTRRERQHAAIAKVLHRKIRAAVDPTTADIATATYDLGQVAARLAAAADYDGLTALIAADLTADRLTAPGAAPTALPAEPLEPVIVVRDEITQYLDAASVEAVPVAEEPPPPAPKTAPVKASKRQPSAAARVASAVARSPRASDATIAARLGLSEATVKRHRRQAVDSVSTASAPALHAA